MDLKRLKEINDRKSEIRSTLEGNEEVNLDETRAELEKLNKEEEEIRSRQEIADEINVGKIETKVIEKPKMEVRSDMEKDLDSMEYRNAFKDYVQTGVMADEFRASAMTAGNAAVIPIPTLNKIVEKMEQYGNILPLVSKMAYPAGVAIPTANMGITASWVSEGTVAGQQGAATASITFGSYKLQCRVGISFEMSVKALSAFETALINNVSKAMVKAVEAAIIAGDGKAKPAGIINETVDSDRNIAVKTFDYKTLVAIEAAIPSAYDGTGVYVLNKKSFLQFASMTDTNGQPIARVNYGVDGKPERSLLGRTVILTDYLPSYDSTAVAGVFGFVFDLSNYVLNTGFDVTIRKYIDENTDDEVTKATMLIDGKVVDSNGLVLLSKPKA